MLVSSPQCDLALLEAKVRKDTVDVSLEAPYINNESSQVEHTTERVNTAERLKRALDSSQSQKELVMMGVTAYDEK